MVNYELVKVNYESGANMGKIDPYTSYKSVFTTSQNKEMIFSYLEDGGGIDKRLAPNSNGGWGGGYNPTQEMSMHMRWLKPVVSQLPDTRMKIAPRRL